MHKQKRPALPTTLIHLTRQQPMVSNHDTKKTRVLQDGNVNQSGLATHHELGSEATAISVVPWLSRT